MGDFLFNYKSVEPTTWVYLSSLLLIGLFFKFGRFWSVRNLDLVLLILLGPGLLMVHYSQAEQGVLQQQAAEMEQESPSTEGQPPPTPSPPDADETPDDAAVSDQGDTEAEEDENSPAAIWRNIEVSGFIFLFGVGTLLLTRLLLDPIMVRRPLLEPNLSLGGLSFMGCALFVFLMANVVADPVMTSDAADYRIARVAAASTHGPGYQLLSQLPSGMTKSFSIVSQLLVVTGVVLTGYWHFRNITMGIGAATLYLMLPYTSLLTGRVEHVLPAATLVWTVLMYRRPIIAGSLIGLASGLVYYPFFLLPLWLSFYWHRGFTRFLSSYLVTISILVLGLLVFSPTGLWDDLRRMFGLWAPAMTDLGGIWGPGGFDSNYRLPVLVTFLALSISMALWPAQKNLGTLLSCTSAIMVATQFWHGYGGGTYMAWYLPLTLLTIFRPNLEDRVAISVLENSWLVGRSKLPKAA